jgi:adenylate kinase family enzyme
VLGCPGTTRQEIAQNLGAYFNWMPINTGDILRKEVGRKTEQGMRIQECIENFLYGKGQK